MPIVNFPGTSETATTAQHRPRTRTVQRLQQGGAQPASPSEPLYDSANGPSGSLPTPLGNMPALSQTHPYSTILISLEETHLPKGNGSGRTRTCNPRIWSPVLYPIRATDPPLSHLYFFMRGMRATDRAKFPSNKFIGSELLILGCGIVFVFAPLTGKSNKISHNNFSLLLLQDFGDNPRTHRAAALPNRKPQPLIHRNRGQ